MPLEYQDPIRRKDLQDNPDKLYVFGDNMLQTGLGGQAAEMRGEPNAVGIPTKRSPSMAVSAFFTNADITTAEPRIREAFARLLEHHNKGGIIVWPYNDIGTGRAQLEARAPEIWRLIQTLKSMLIIE